MTSFRMIAVSIRKKQDMNYTKFKPRPQNEACHNNHIFFISRLIQNTFRTRFRTVFTAEPQEPGTLYHATSGTLTV